MIISLIPTRTSSYLVSHIDVFGSSLMILETTCSLNFEGYALWTQT